VGLEINGTSYGWYLQVKKSKRVEKYEFAPNTKKNKKNNELISISRAGNIIIINVTANQPTRSKQVLV